MIKAILRALEHAPGAPPGVLNSVWNCFEVVKVTTGGLALL